MVENFEPGKSSERLSTERPFLVIAHAYQPHREALFPSSGERQDVVSWINERIYNEVYKPILVDGESLPRMAFSIYPGLRDWLRNSHPQEFNQIVEKINGIPNKEYHVFGDPYIHLILPLQEKEDQDMLVKLGKEAFRRDLGFEPKGIWFPETAVSKTTLDVVLDNGYEFVALRDSQLQRADDNPMKVRTETGREISVIHFNTGLSGSLSFNEGVTLNADNFLDGLSGSDSRKVAVGSDLELYGHWKRDRDKFLKYLEKPGTLEKHGFIPFDIKAALKSDDIYTTEVWDNTSWSCEHSLGRWTGECNDDGANERTRSDKRTFYKTLLNYGIEINTRLDATTPNWRDDFVEFFINNRDLMFNSKVHPEIPVLNDGNRLYWAKYCEIVGKTSCGWFFGGEEAPEREFPRAMIAEVEKLVPDIKERTIFDRQAA
jgi:alpha-amylase/alpha-mannosidase (GH57 family)